MSEIFREVDKALTYDRLRALWKRYRIVIVATLVLALTSLAAWQVWQYQRQQQRTRSAEAFFALLRNNATQEPLQQDLLQHEQQTLRGGYRMLWLFSRAKAFAQQQKWQQAQEALGQVANDRSLSPLYRHYAQIWQASLDLEQGRLEAAAKRLVALSAKTSSASPNMQGLALYLQAALLTTQGNKAGAHDLLTRALALESLAPALGERLRQAERALETISTP